MSMLAAMLALVAPLAFAGDELGRMVRPVSSLYPEVVIRKGETEHEWPFAVDAGELGCVQLGEQRSVFFSEILTPEEQGTFGNMKLPRMVVVTANPMAFLVTVEDRELYAPFDSLETLIKRLAPFETMGLALCDKAKDTPQGVEL